MKFANIIMTRKGRCTVGDDIQLIAIEYLYKYMGVDYSNVIRIPFSELSTYDGEYVVLPLSFPFYGYNNGTNITNFSPKIIPVFLGFATMQQYYSQKDIEYLKNFEPIGCRDQYTMEALREQNIMAYLNGCMTITLPKVRNGADGKEKIFCVDLTPKIIAKIPDALLSDCVFTNHVYFSEECPQGTEQKAKEVFNAYIKEARMIITTRMHAALPCIAFGIPVILVKEKMSLRFPMIQSLIPVYTEDDFDKIDWNPQSIDCESLKEKVLTVSSKRVWDAYNRYKDIYDISSFYEKETPKNLFIDNFTNTISYIKQHYKANDSFSYILWGITQTAAMVYQYICQNYKNAKLVAVIDQYKKLDFCGKSSTNKEVMSNFPDALCFICSGAAMPEAKEYFNEIKHKHVFYCWSDGLLR